MKLFFSISLILILSSSLAQNSISLLIIDSDSKEAVPFVKVTVKNKNRGTYSNEKGIVSLDNLMIKDTLYINHIGYESKLLLVKNLKYLKQISLIPTTYILNETTIKASNYKETLIGYSRIKSNSTLGTSIIGSETAVLIEPENITNAYINEIIFKIRNKSKNNPIVRFHLYKNKKGFPGEEIFIKDNLFTIKSKNKVKINIQNENIKLPKQGIFVSLEWIGIFEKNGTVHHETTLIHNLRLKTKSKTKAEKAYHKRWNDWEVSPGFFPLFGLKIVEYNE